MRIDYRILWVEDDRSWYKTTLELFEGILDDLGFNLTSKKCENIEEVKAEYFLNRMKEYDMLLIDYTLKNSDSGDKIIEFIRGVKEEPILTDVLFYSSAVENVRDSMFRLGLEGVYTADRKDIETKFEQVLKTTIKKIQEINSMRGLIMGETSDLDVHIETLTINIATEILKLDQVALDKIIFEHYDSVGKNIPKLKERYNTVGFKNWFHKIEANAKWSICRQLLKNKAFKDDIMIKTFLANNSTYFDEVIEIRNKFAHSKSITKNGINVLKAQLGKEDFEYDDEKFITIRTNLKNHRKHIEDLLSHFNIDI